MNTTAIVLSTAYIFESGSKRTTRTFVSYLGFTLVELMLSLAVVGLLAAIASVAYGHYLERVKIYEAVQDIHAIALLIKNDFIDTGQYPDSLSDIYGNNVPVDPWGNVYQYLNIATAKGNGKVRKDHNLVPLNTDFDLYSMGKDGKSVSPLTAAASRDDIVRANNGAFVGLAENY